MNNSCKVVGCTGVVWLTTPWARLRPWTPLQKYPQDTYTYTHTHTRTRRGSFGFILRHNGSFRWRASTRWLKVGLAKFSPQQFRLAFRCLIRYTLSGRRGNDTIGTYLTYLFRCLHVFGYTSLERRKGDSFTICSNRDTFMVLYFFFIFYLSILTAFQKQSSIFQVYTSLAENKIKHGS